MVRKKPILARDVKVTSGAVIPEAQSLENRRIIEKAKAAGQVGGDVLGARQESAQLAQQGIQQRVQLGQLQQQQTEELRQLREETFNPQSEQAVPAQPGVLEAAGRVGQQGTPLNLQTPLSTPGALSLLPTKAAGVVTLGLSAVAAGVLAFAGGGAAAAAATATPKAAAATSALAGISVVTKGILGAIGISSIPALTGYLTEGRYSEIKGNMATLRSSSAETIRDVAKGGDPLEAMETLDFIEGRINELAASLKLANTYTLKGQISGRSPEEDIYRTLNTIVRRRQAMERYLIDGNSELLLLSVGTEVVE